MCRLRLLLWVRATLTFNGSSSREPCLRAGAGEVVAYGVRWLPHAGAVQEPAGKTR